MLFAALQVLGLGVQGRDKKLYQGKAKRILKRLAINGNDSICFAVHKSSNFDCNLISKIGNFVRSMSASKKRKILDDGRMFSDEWFLR